jgi:hypothetical protein
MERSFRNVLKKCKRWNDRRNDIAHGLVVKVPSVAPGYYLWPTPYNTRKYPFDARDPSYHLRAAQIRKIAFAFKKLRKQTAKLAQRLEDHAREREQVRRQMAERIRQVKEADKRGDPLP